MKKLFITLILALSVVALLPAQDHNDEMSKTNQVIDHFAKGEIAWIFDQFDDNMKAAITMEKLGEIWPSLQQQCGRYIASGEAVSTEAQGYVVVNQLIDFETTDLDIRLAFNKDKQISGLFFVPPVKKKD